MDQTLCLIWEIAEQWRDFDSRVLLLSPGTVLRCKFAVIPEPFLPSFVHFGDQTSVTKGNGKIWNRGVILALVLCKRANFCRRRTFGKKNCTFRQHNLQNKKNEGVPLAPKHPAPMRETRPIPKNNRTPTLHLASTYQRKSWSGCGEAPSNLKLGTETGCTSLW